MTNDNYKTTDWLLKIFGDWFDPCPFNPKPEFDGLKIEWKDKTYVNPPYSNPLPWVMKAIEENKKGKTISLLLKLDCSTKWFLMLCNAKAHIILINERVKFNGKPAMFPSIIALLE